MKSPKVVIFCGGMGTRLKEETEYKPKPLVEVGGLPILWHIMKLYSFYGMKDFILCLGYKGDMIKEFFMHYDWKAFDFTLNLKSKGITFHESDIEDWNITFVDTGQETLIGGRLKQVEKYVDTDIFHVTYGDGVSDINLNSLSQFHAKQGKIGTITCVRPHSKYGVVRVKKDLITHFKEKPILDDYVNGGFMVFHRSVFAHVIETRMLEDGTLPLLVEKNELAGYIHDGFWYAMDTYKDYTDLNKMHSSGSHPWMVWK